MDNTQYNFDVANSFIRQRRVKELSRILLMMGVILLVLFSSSAFFIMSSRYSISSKTSNSQTADTLELDQIFNEEFAYNDNSIGTEDIEILEEEIEDNGFTDYNFEGYESDESLITSENIPLSVEKPVITQKIATLIQVTSAEEINIDQFYIVIS